MSSAMNKLEKNPNQIIAWPFFHLFNNSVILALPLVLMIYVSSLWLHLLTKRNLSSEKALLIN